MPEISVILKYIIGLILTVAAWWFNDLRAKQNRATSRTDAALEKINKNCERLTKLESETITEVESSRQAAEMERRIMDTFNKFRLEFKDDFSKFRVDLKTDLNEIKHERRDN